MRINIEDEINDGLLEYSISLMSNENLISQHKTEFRKVVMDIYKKHDDLLLSNIVLCLGNHYDIEFIVSLLNKKDVAIIKKEYLESLK